MYKRTHWRLARLAVGKIDGMYPELLMKGFRRFLFYAGTIGPDLSVMQFAHPHFYDKSAGYVYSKIEKLKERELKGFLDTYMLGTMVHYLCDFCCYAHIDGRIGTVISHLNYERKINKYLNKYYRLLQIGALRNQVVRGNASELIPYIDGIIRQYKRSKPSCLIDIEKSLEISSALILGQFVMA
jgi:hypothetical protein